VPVPSAAGTIDCAWAKEGQRRNGKENKKKYFFLPFRTLLLIPPRVGWGLPSGEEVFLPEGFATSRQPILPTATFL
jgi:hypothetical protein